MATPNRTEYYLKTHHTLSCLPPNRRKTTVKNCHFTHSVQATLITRFESDPVPVGAVNRKSKSQLSFTSVLLSFTSIFGQNRPRHPLLRVISPRPKAATGAGF